MTIKLVAPEGYKYKDKMTERLYSEVITDDSKQNRYELVPASDEPIIEM